MAPDKSRVTATAVGLFAFGTIIVTMLGLMEEQRWISKEFEGLARLVICGIVTTALLILGLQATSVRRIRLIIVSGFLAVQLGYLLSYTEDVSALNDVPLIGSRSQFSRIAQPVLDGCWTFVVLYIVYVSVRHVQVANRNLAANVEQLEHSRRQSSLANDHLLEVIDELKTMQQQLQEQERLRVIGEMSSGIAHDLNNALTPLTASAQLLILSVTDPTTQQSDVQNQIESSALDVSAIVERLRQFHRKNESVLRRPTDLTKLIGQIVDGTRPKWKYEPELQGEEICVQVEAPQLSVDVDPTDIRMVLTNLMFNSVQGMPGGGRILISVRECGDHAEVTVCDNGIGMNTEQLQKCREPFFTTKTGGSGLGLAMCQRVLRAYDEDLSMESVPGEGTTVWFSLPLSRRALAELPDEQVSITAQRVLVVDDNELVRRTVSNLLQHLGMAVEPAANGYAALEAIRKSRFDLIITDFGMRGMTGADVIRESRCIRPGQRVAVLSGWSAGRIQECCVAGYQPDAILAKPVNLQTLRSLLSAQHVPSSTSSIVTTSPRRIAS